MVRAGALPLMAALLRHHAVDAEAAFAAGGLLPMIVELLWNLVELAADDVAEVVQGGAGNESRALAGTSSRSGRSTPGSATISSDGSGGSYRGSSSGGSGIGGSSGSSGDPQVAGSSFAAQSVTDAVGSLFQQLLQSAGHRAGKELRNDVLTVLQLLSSFPPCAAVLHSSGTYSLLLAAAAAPELRTLDGSSITAAQHAFTRDALDVEMKLLLWSTVVNAAEADAACLAMMGGSSFLPLMLQHAEPGPAPAPVCEPVSRLPPEHRAMLRRAAWAALLRAAPLAKRAFLEAADGAVAVVRCLHACLPSNGPVGGLDGSPVGDEAGCGGVLGSGERPRALSAGNNQGQLRGSSHSLGNGACNSQGQLRSSSAVLGSSSAVGECEGIEMPARLVAKLCRGAGAAEASEWLSGKGVISMLLKLLKAGDQLHQASGQQQAVGVHESSWRQAVLWALTAVCEAGGAACLKLLRSGRGVMVLLEEVDR